MKLTTTGITNFKTRPLQSVNLQLQEKVVVLKGEIFELYDFKPDRNKHWKITLKLPFQGRREWFVYQGHARLELDPSNRPPSVRLAIPYRSQLDNKHNPAGACNVTSLAMAIEYLDPTAGDLLSKQFEDHLYRLMENNNLNRHSPQDLAKVVNEFYSLKDDFTVWGTIDRCQNHLAAGNPCVIHGYFTSFGHIIILAGYDDKGFIVHDPYGEWFESGYRTDLSGKYLHYSYKLIEQTCIPDGQFWVHYIYR
ncbi:C39 family peptidase [Microcoleus sp. herbarium14]|uniref:C39 family peptidase n=1 Tax=Microcoleus sp. herbarium14 TaxID=3055439 RepID=UPI002FD740D0